ncbi:SMR family transporter [Acetobacter oeni]|uniref:Multidrug transporter n=1 Tax=Acetobacter oeni TaxID=304077 RepID=A0A511XMR2_9PROT|nr:SMR family transporter [Acetobacter oeni]MBB3884124.1 small multidrug resistance pump [Acetobacter oeni]NHO20127.1 QacE family quaternary ammonium compound efflux SMR transporter [Acetobacter oeni]GBR04319.1 quaternary ammonium compound resistance protein [Acetobacter oeni LMG 21952]GEN64230.1 multidrug transporter [Acetobacter oeni]
MNRLFLAVAILSEVIATSCMKASDGYTKLVPSAISILCYVVSFYFLSQALKTIPTGIAYAIWSGVGIVLISLIAWLFQGQKLDTPGIAGMTLIIAGCLIMNLFSKTSAH